ncbi:hypothetical protein N7541_003126 [Penicillium brevicompactum]|uniref:RNase MRP protein 1 RNA binding domain-containing protein n=1 Tax=Penicillium brevicompactum TaxID=5074 RepID=A0A9W9RLD2_PENBR|nr:hypothetical protein N7541_003126 [Penicillium brevicompactum]
MEELLAVHSLLHLIFHRNKNQHHRTKWWKWLSMLKRATADLAQAEPSAMEAQKQHLAAHIIPRCYVAFSTVVADNQFSTLGVVLLAALARLSKITGISQEMKKRSTTSKARNPASAVIQEDLGERIRRVEDVSLPSVPPSALPPPNKAGPEEKSTKDRSALKSAKKTKKKKNAIDDLFSSLL